MGRLKTLETNASLAGGYTSEGLQKEGPRMTLMASFRGLSEATTARLEQSVDGTSYNEIPGSEATISAGTSEQMWNDCGMLSEGSYVRVSVDAVSGTLYLIKMLS